MEEQVLWICSMIGTVAFAVSGALMAVDKGMDLLGVLFLGCVTAVGGGVLRDVLLGKTPPAMFVQSEFLLAAAITSLAVFLISYWLYARIQRSRERVDHIINLFDAVGLGAFAVAGERAAISAGHGDNTLLVLFLGLTTAVGGGLLRDILCGQIPFVLRKRIYVFAAFAGSLLYYWLRTWQEFAAMTVGMASVVLIRLLASRFRWNMPRVRTQEEWEEKRAREPLGSKKNRHKHSVGEGCSGENDDL